MKPKAFDKDGSFRVREATVLKGCRRLLDILERQGLLTYVRINVSPIIRTTPTGRNFYTKNKDMRGMPDLLVWITNGPVLCIETKSKTGVLEHDQKAFRDRILGTGHDYIVARTLDDLIDILRTHGVHPGTLF